MDDSKQVNLPSPSVAKNRLLDSYAAVDITDITIILQCMGFTLQSFEKSNTTYEQGSELINIDLNCSKSGIRAHMTKKLHMCKCPKNPEEGEIWNVSGCGPCVKTGEIIESNCSLLPRIADNSRQIIKNMLLQMLPLISEENVNTDHGFKRLKNIALLSRFRSLDTLITTNPATVEFGTNQLVVNGTQSWEIDPKTTPPANTSSPRRSIIEPLYKMKQNIANLVDQIQQIIDNNDEVVNSTFVSKPKPKNVRRVSDIEPVQKPVTPTLPMPTVEFLAKKRRKLVSPKINTPTVDKVKLHSTSKVGSIRNKALTPKANTQTQITPKPYIQRQDTSRKEILRQDTPRQDTPRPIRSPLRYQLNKIDSNAKPSTPIKKMMSIHKITLGSIPKKLGG